MSYLSNQDLALLVDWAREKNRDRKFILNKKTWEKCVIFGADSPQRRYLQFIELANQLWLAHGDNLAKAKEVKNSDELLKYFKTKSGLYGMKKEDFDRVSNFWLKPIQSVALAATNQALSSQPPARAQKYIDDSNIGSGKVKEFWQRFGDSAQGLQHKVIPAAGGADFESKKAAQVTKTGQLKGTEHHVYDFAVRRACKFLMYDAKALKCPVFYALDGLNLSIIVDLVAGTGALRDTVKVGDTPEEKKVPVCTSELRELFRYWDVFANHVTFFKDFVQVDPPWEQCDVDKWGRYAVLRAKKTRGLAMRAGKGTEMPDENVIDGWTGATAVTNYHGLRPGRFHGTPALNSVTTAKETL